MTPRRNIGEIPDFSLQAAKERFESDAALAQHIVDQNYRFDEIAERIEDDDFRGLAYEGLADEQARFLDRLSADDTSIYEDFGRRQLYVESEIGRLAARQAIRENEFTEREAYIDAQAEITVELVPEVKTPADELADAKKRELATSTTEEVENEESELAKLKAEKQQLDELDSIMASGWAVPRAIGNKTTDGIEIVVIDEIPVEPRMGTHLSPEERLQRYTERCVDAPEATKFIALFLSENVGRIVTVRELSEFLYNKEVLTSKSRHHIRARVTTALGPKIRSAKVQSLLDGDELTLQFGFRTTKTKRAGKVIKSSKKRIYRAVPKSEFGPGHTESRVSRREHITWEVTEAQRQLIDERSHSDEVATPITDDQTQASREKRKIEAKNASSQIAEILISAGGEFLSVKELAALLYPASEQPPSVLRNRVYALVALSRQGKGFQKILEKQGYEVEVGTVERQPIDGKRQKAAMALRVIPFAAESTSQQPEEEEPSSESDEPGLIGEAEKNKAEPDWVPSFRADVQEVIGLLEEEGLIYEGALKWGVIMARSSSRKMGTKTAFQKLLDAKLITREQHKAKELGSVDIVAMRLFGTHQAYLRPGPKQEIATSTIREELVMAQQSKKSK